MSVVSFFTASTSTQKRREKEEKKCAQKWAPSPIHASRVTTTRKENPIENIPRRALPRRGPLPRLRVRLVCPFAFPSRGSPSQPLKKKNKVGRITFYAKKKIGIQRQNDRVPCSSALGIIFWVRPPYVCKSHDECECERCSKRCAYRCFLCGIVRKATLFWVLAQKTLNV